MGESVQLSIIVPSHNTRELTLRCLQSALEAGPSGTEVILVDDGSSDGTAEAVESDLPGVRVLFNARPQGFSPAANRGLAEAGGDVLLLLNSDTEVTTEGLAQLLAALDADPKLGIAGGQLYYPDGRPQWSGGKAPDLLWLFALGSSLPRVLRRLPGYRALRPLEAAAGATVEWVSGAALAMRRAVWEQVGPLDEGYRFYCQDLDLCLAARAAGWKVALLPEFRVIHHHGATIRQQAGTLRRQHLELLWADLVRWAGRHRGPAAEKWAVRMLRWGAGLRLAARYLAGLSLWLRPAEQRRAWWQDTRVLQRARASLVLRELGQGDLEARS